MSRNQLNEYTVTELVEAKEWWVAYNMNLVIRFVTRNAFIVQIKIVLLNDVFVVWFNIIKYMVIRNMFDIRYK